MEKAKTNSVSSAQSHLPQRPPVVVVLGHVNHGKTTLLDKIRASQVAAKEPGGISQYLTASQVEFRGRTITFLDTPGHEAFVQMRARGGSVADLALLVVSAVEGVKAQTQEVLVQILTAKLPFMVVLTKVDLPEAEPRRVKEELSKNGVLLEGWGGHVVCLEVSGKTGAGLETLLEMIQLQADLLELKADLNKPFAGVVLEAHLDPKRGSVALVLGKEGVLTVGQVLQAGKVVGKVRALRGADNRSLSEVKPSQPVEILGFKEVPPVGETVSVGEDLSRLKEKAVSRPRDASLAAASKVLPVVLRADRVGTLEALVQSLKALDVDGWRVNLLLSATGSVTASDVLLAKANRALLLAFAVSAPEDVAALARESAVTLHFYRVIYELADAVKRELADFAKVESLGHRSQGKIIKIFPLPSGDKVAGTQVARGRFHVGQILKLLRVGQEVTRLKVKTIKIKTEKVNSVAAGGECGLLFAEKALFQVGDLLEEV